ncbi:MAG TPA: Gfo/Idh/MocA family oxidoreductase [Firmicutes bacterium]|nr:Gfo/Idh/MocA family oxidoreductase [Bacillota bacterium]
MRLAILGGGRCAAAYGKAVGEVSGLELVAVAATVNSARRKMVLAEQLQVPIYDDYKRLLAVEKPEAVIIALPPLLHEPAAIAAAAAGAHLLIDLPLAPTMEGCDRIITAASRAGVTLMTGHRHRYFQNIAAARMMVNEGELGRLLFSITARYWPYFSSDRSSWKYDVKLAGGGAWLTHGIHLVDRICWLHGELPEAVTARMLFSPDNPHMEISVVAQLEFPGGSTAAIMLAMQAGKTVEYNELVGVDGRINYQTHGPLVLTNNRALVTKIAEQGGNAGVAVLQEFIAAVARKSEPAALVEWGREMVGIIRAGYDSVNLSRKIALPRSS